MKPLQALRRALGLAGALALAQAEAAPLQISWTNNVLTVRDARLPGGRLEILYLEAFCRAGGWTRDWRETKIPHTTRLVGRSVDGSELRFQTRVEPNVEVVHSVIASEDELDCPFEFTNRGNAPSDIQWFQPACVRVAAFTGRGQSNYTSRSFVFTKPGMTTLDFTLRTTSARYEGGQVYLPPWTAPADANPRPLNNTPLANGLIGCFSADNRQLLAIASDRTHELFEGVYVCLHSDPLVGGLKPGEKKTLTQKIYLLPNDVDALLTRYREDFHPTAKRW